ncbi:ribosomal protein S6 kinase delta-1 [Panulirus ornatus]|uniref:ribosomal protein S6 kinase delta-1 n=1 Tax=Panulirus ornatus TaxID=150431 RepID=UPI003A89A864
MAAKTDQWVRIFQVEETKRHTKGYTIYQVKSTVFPRISPEASTSVVVWRRYSELRRLHKAISELHQKLGLPGQVPSFPRATVLNRFEADVVETRRQATLNLLKFIGQHSPLFTSEPFTKFFQNEENSSKPPSSGKKKKNSKGRSKEAESLASTLGIQESSSLYSQLSDTEDDFSICSSLDSPQAVGPSPPLPGGISIPPTESLASDAAVLNDGSCEDIDAYLKSVKEDHAGVQDVSSILQRTSIDKYNSKEINQKISLNKTIENKRKECRVSDLSWDMSCGNGVEDSVFKFPTRNCDVRKVDSDILNHVERHASTSSLSSLSSQPCCVYENPVHDSPKQHHKSQLNDEAPKVSNGKTTSSTPVQETPPVKETPHHVPPLDVTRRMSSSDRKNSVPLTPLTPLTKTVTPVIPTHKVPSPQEVANTQYIFVAAQQINEAQQYEQQKDYKQALNMYREGVGTLLQGVQGDGDGSRREAVRRKTAQYLQRAEQLVARLTRKDKRKEQCPDGPPPETSNSGEGGLKCRASDIQRYRVAGLAGSVIIATDTTNGDTVAIKVLIKSGSGSGEKTIVPKNVPFMLPIIRYHETDTAIYLVLKFISGGKLWSHISKYVEEAYTDPNEILDTSINTYAGRRLLQETTEYDGLASEALSLCETTSLTSHLSSQIPSHQSCSQTTPSTSNFLTVPGCSSIGGSSGCSEASSSCLPDGYLQLFSEYTHSLPSSSSMVVIPPLGQSTTVATDSVPKSMSAGALVVSAGCSDISKDAPDDARLSVAEDNNILEDGVLVNGTNLVNEEDKVSIGSDTLSGVSEDFSCSLPVSVPSVLPDPLHLPEVKITTDSYLEPNLDPVDSSCPVGEPHHMENKVGAIDGKTSQSDMRNCQNEVEEQRHHEKNDEVKSIPDEKENEVNHNREDKTLPTGHGGREALYLKTSHSHLGVEDERDDNSITDTSFGSMTLPSLSWTKREDSELASLDIEDLIRNSKKLLQNVDYTLQQSKSQCMATFHESDESTSIEHSELPYDSGSIGFDHTDKEKKSSSKKENEKKIAHNKHSTSVLSVQEPLIAHHSRSPATDQKPHESNLKAAKNESSMLIQPKLEVDLCEISKACDSNESQIEKSQCEIITQGIASTEAIQDIIVQSEQPQNVQATSNSGFKEHFLTNKFDVPVESSLAALLEKYSASRGHDLQPRLPEGIVKVWLSQVITAITALHQLGIVWGDFNPDNVLLDDGGSILVTYESRWSSVQRNVRGGKSWKCMNGQHAVDEAIARRKKGYLAPELESPLAHPTTASDWWSVGSLMYHMLTGQSVSAAHPSGITSHTELLMPSHLTPEAASLISQLLCAHPTERLGGGVAGAQEIKDHAFFTGIQWPD